MNPFEKLGRSAQRLKHKAVDPVPTHSNQCDSHRVGVAGFNLYFDSLGAFDHARIVHGKCNIRYFPNELRERCLNATKQSLSV